MSTWKNITANSNLIEFTTDKSILIKLPKSDFVFWHPAKLVRINGKNNYRMSIGYTDSFIFNIFKQGKGQYNKTQKIAEKQITVEEFEAYFA
jgi:hypothetical protein|nr:MAG TPA: hypothetical protein [Caudoviricetes sp.]